MNTVCKILFDFNMENEVFAHSLYRRWDDFFILNVEKIADKVLQKYDKDAVMLEIDELNLDIGAIEEENFNHYFPLLFEEKLEEALLKYIYNPLQANVQQIIRKDYLFDMLCKFLLHGSLPWNIANEYKDINHLFLSVLRTDGKQLKSFLQVYGHYTALQQRLVYQLNDPELENGVRLLAPSESVFICSYIHLLRIKYREIERPLIQESDYRNVTWAIVYAYLLNNRSSYFNKKSFIIQTTQQIAIKYNLTYEHLLAIITIELESLATRQAMPSELFLILDQLRKELSEKRFRAFTTDAVKLYKVLSQTSKNDKTDNLTPDTLRALFIILAKEDSCRSFIAALKESEIENLVEYIIPNDSKFIIQYTRSLDKQKEQGGLHGKVGEEFRLLKWQIIFPVLLRDNGLSFNRKYFVKSVLQGVASHYNLKLQEVLTYICSQLYIFKINKELTDIFLNLLDEMQSKGDNVNKLLPKQPDFNITLSFIRNKKELTTEEAKLLIHQFTKAGFRKKIIDSISEEEHYHVTRIIVPSESHFIIAYAIGLNRQQSHGALEGKAGGEFKQVKWDFIYTVLFESQAAFNKEYFVNKTLHKISAHYNITVGELLTYFYHEMASTGISFPFDLVKVIYQLVKKHTLLNVNKQQIAVETIKGNGNTTQKKIARQLLQKHFGNNAEYKPLIAKLTEQYEFVNYIEQILQTGQLLFQYLQVTLKITINRKRILSLLLKLSTEYEYLSRADIMVQILNLIKKELKKEQAIKFDKEIKRLSDKNQLLSTYTQNNNQYTENDMENVVNKQFSAERDETPYTFINNAGMVLFLPFIPRLFSSLSLTKDGLFKSKEEQIRAIFLLQYAVFGDRKFPEHELTLNKLLTGLETITPVPQEINLTKIEKDTVASMLNGLLQNWTKLKNTSIEGLQEAFLKREGKIEEREDGFHLTIADKAYDMLLDSVPWNFRVLKFGWMKKAVFVKWR